MSEAVVSVGCLARTNVNKADPHASGHLLSLSAKVMALLPRNVLRHASQRETTGIEKGNRAMLKA